MRVYRHFLFVMAILAPFFGCDSFVLTEQFTSTNILPLAIHPAAVATRPEGKVSFIAVGGRPPFAFAVASTFDGKIDPVTGLYTAPIHDGEYEVEVEDADGAVSVGFVFVKAAKALSITPTTATVESGGEPYQFGAFGGTFPYHFSFTTDGDGESIGTINSEGLFSAADNIVGTGIVTLEDSSGSIVTARVYVQDDTTLMLRPAENPIQQGQTVLLYPRGGDGDYRLQIKSEDAVLEYRDETMPYGSLSLGAYTASNSIGTVVIRVTSGDGDSSQSHDLEMTILPATPADFAASGATGDPKTIRLTWTHGKPGANGFRIERSLDGAIFTTIADSSTLGPDARSYIDSGRQPNTMYEYRMYTYLSEQYESRATASILTISNQ